MSNPHNNKVVPVITRFCQFLPGLHLGFQLHHCSPHVPVKEGAQMPPVEREGRKLIHPAQVCLYLCPILKLLDPVKPFTMEADTSKSVVGAVVS